MPGEMVMFVLSRLGGWESSAVARSRRIQSWRLDIEHMLAFARHILCGVFDMYRSQFVRAYSCQCGYSDGSVTQ
jgi:hypothetical protein